MRKRVLITGGTSDIGTSLCEQYVKNNYEVIFTYFKNEDKALEITKKFNIKGYKCDISNEFEVKNLFKNIDYLDILINNAAAYQDNSIYDKTGAEFLSTLNVNVVGTFLVSKYASLKMNKGIIINISSTDSIDTFNELNIDYSTSKGAINTMTKILSNILSDIKVIAILPNWVDTASTREINSNYLAEELARINQKRLLTKEEVADSIYNLVLDDKIPSGSLIRLDDSGERII